MLIDAYATIHTVISIIQYMQLTTIQALDARRRLGELLELAYYKGEGFRIARKDKPMAWLVGDPFM